MWGPLLIGSAATAAIVKAKMGRPHFPKQKGAYSVPEGPEKARWRPRRR